MVDALLQHEDRSGVRTVLLLILLLVVLLWGWNERSRRKPLVSSPSRAIAPSSHVEMYDGKAIRVLRDFPYRYDLRMPVWESTLDVYVPQGRSKLPLLVYLHGGGWIGGDKSGIGPKAKTFAAAGFVVASVNYRLAPVSGPPNACSDIAAALAYLRHLAPDISADPDRIVLMGHSAGAHLAALLVADERYLGDYPELAQSIRALVLLDGSAYDVPQMMQSERGQDYAGVFGDDEKLWQEVSPRHHAEGRTGMPPALLIYADEDEIRRESATWLGAAIERGGSRATILSAPEKDHHSVDEDLADPNDRITMEVMRFLRQALE